MLLIHGVLLGLGATILFDLWLVALGRGLPDMGMMGRWAWHLTKGKVFHEDIARAEPHPQEKALGWAFHYAVGIAYGVIFLLIVGPGWLAAPRLLPAWVFGLATLAFGWFLFQPGLGQGIAASRTPDPTRRRVEGLIGHTIFGFGLWLTGLAI